MFSHGKRDHDLYLPCLHNVSPAVVSPGQFHPKALALAQVGSNPGDKEVSVAF